MLKSKDTYVSGMIEIHDNKERWFVFIGSRFFTPQSRDEKDPNQDQNRHHYRDHYKQNIEYPQGSR